MTVKYSTQLQSSMLNPNEVAQLLSQDLRSNYGWNTEVNKGLVSWSDIKSDKSPLKKSTDYITNGKIQIQKANAAEFELHFGFKIKLLLVVGILTAIMGPVVGYLFLEFGPSTEAWIFYFMLAGGPLISFFFVGGNYLLFKSIMRGCLDQSLQRIESGLNQNPEYDS